MYVWMDVWMDGCMDGWMGPLAPGKGGGGVGRERETLKLVVAQVRPPVGLWGGGMGEMGEMGNRLRGVRLSYVRSQLRSVAPPPAAALVRYRDRDSGATRVTYCD